MEGSRLDQVRELFVRLTDLPPTERAEILEGLSDDVRREVEGLLSGDGHAASQLSSLDHPFEVDHRPGRIGRFEFGRRLGGGGMGIVYEALDTRLDRPVAIKILHHGAAFDPVANARFKREARAASRLAHRNICAIHEFGETEQGVLRDSSVARPMRPKNRPAF